MRSEHKEITTENIDHVDFCYISPTLVACMVKSNNEYHIDIMDIKTQEIISTIKDRRSPKNAFDMHLSPDGNLITVSSDRIILWSHLASKHPKSKIIPMNKERVTATYLSDNNYLYIAHIYEIYCWNLNTGESKLIAKSPNIHIRSIHSIDHQYLLCLGSDSFDYKLFFIIDLNDALHTIKCVTIGDYLYATDKAAVLSSNRLAIPKESSIINKIEIYAISTDTKQLLTSIKTAAPIVSLVLAPNGWLACSEENRTIEFFDPDTYERMHVISLPYRQQWHIHWNLVC